VAGEGVHAGVLKIGLAALANLAAAPSNADLIGEEDGVEMTVEAVNVALSVRGEAPDMEMLMHAAEALRNLASSATNRRRLLGSGGLDLVMRTMLEATRHAADTTAGGTPHTHTSDMHSATLHLLARLAEDEELRDAVLLPSAITQVQTGMAAFEEHPGVQASACRFLSTLLQAEEDEEHAETSTPSAHAAALDERNSEYFAMAARAVHRHHADVGVRDGCWALCESLARRRWRQEPTSVSLASSESLVATLVRDLTHVHAAVAADSAGLPEVAARLEMACMKLTEIAVDEIELVLAMNVSAALLRGAAQHTANPRAMQRCCMAIWQLAGDPRAREELNRHNAGHLVAQVLNGAMMSAQLQHKRAHDAHQVYIYLSIYLSIYRPTYLFDLSLSLSRARALSLYTHTHTHTHTHRMGTRGH